MKGNSNKYQSLKPAFTIKKGCFASARLKKKKKKIN